MNSGQTCCGVKRIYVQDGVSSEFTERMVARVRWPKQGWGWNDPEVSIGPMINEEALHEMEDWTRVAGADGGKLLSGGKRSPGLKGNFFEPIIIADLPQTSWIQEEIFGPIVSINRFFEDAEGIALANDCQFALTGSVWAKDLMRARKTAEKLNGGTVSINNVASTYGLSSTPWGERVRAVSGTPMERSVSPSCWNPTTSTSTRASSAESCGGILTARKV